MGVIRTEYHDMSDTIVLYYYLEIRESGRDRHKRLCLFPTERGRDGEIRKIKKWHLASAFTKTTLEIGEVHSNEFILKKVEELP